MSTEDKKQNILNAIGELFGDMDADEQEQVEAMEEIESTLRDNIDMLNEQMKSRATGGE